MPIKSAESRESLIKKLKERGLKFNEDKLKKILKDYNYFNLFNGFETLLLPNPKQKPKKYKNENINDFLALYHFDKELTLILISLLGNIEKKT